MITIRQIKPSDEAARKLIEESDRYFGPQYPAASNHLDSIEVLERSRFHFVGAFEGEILLGCGGVKLMPEGYAEIKRLFVGAAARGKGVGRLIMVALEEFLVASQIPTVRLETGIHQQEALALYKKCGYRVIGPFGPYGEDPLSVFMEKSLG